MNQKTKAGFTLIELLVVVLIIGILAAVAVPQYQLARYKSQIVSGIPLAKAFKNAQELYFLANGTYADNHEELDFPIPSNCSVASYEIGETKIKITCGDHTISFKFQSNANAWVSLTTWGCPHPGRYVKYCGEYMLPMSTAKPIVYLATTRPCCKVIKPVGGDVDYERKVCVALGGKLVEGGPSAAGEVYEF